MITDQEKNDAIITTLNIRAYKDHLERVERLAEYCSFWLSEAGTNQDIETAEADLVYLHDMVKAMNLKIKELEAKKSIFLQKLVTE